VNGYGLRPYGDRGTFDEVSALRGHGLSDGFSVDGCGPDDEPAPRATTWVDHDGPSAVAEADAASLQSRGPAPVRCRAPVLSRDGIVA
jgi:hypothetical protein